MSESEFIEASCRLYDVLSPIDKDAILKYRKATQPSQKTHFNVPSSPPRSL